MTVAGVPSPERQYERPIAEASRCAEVYRTSDRSTAGETLLKASRRQSNLGVPPVFPPGHVHAATDARPELGQRRQGSKTHRQRQPRTW